MNFVGALLLITATLAQNCGDTRKMNCKQGCPETNGIRWHHYRTTNKGCCSHFTSCGGNMKHCRFNCASCDDSCPSGYVSKGGVSRNRANTQERYQDCCNKQCAASDCTGIWKPKSTPPVCDGLTCPKNTSKCCVLKDGNIEEGYSFELVKQGNCAQYGYEYITSASTCELGARVLGIDAPFDDGSDRRRFFSTLLPPMIVLNINEAVAGIISEALNAQYRQRNCGAVGHSIVTYTDETSGENIGNMAGKDKNDNDAQQWQICKARTTSKLQCGSHACAYYYKNIGGTAVSSLLNSEKWLLGRFDKQEQLVDGLKTKANYANDYGVHVEAWVTAPHTGYYKFMTRSDDSSVVYASVKPYMKNGEMKKVVELNGCCKRVKGSVSLYWHAGKSYFVKGYMKEGGGGDYFEIGYDNQNNEWNIIPASHLISGGCTTVEIENVVIESDSVTQTDNYAVKEDMSSTVNTCGTMGGYTGSIEQGAKTSITTSWEFTTDDSWSNTFGFTASVGTTIKTKVNAGIQLKAVNLGSEVEQSVTANFEAKTEFTTSGSEKETNGETTTDEVYSTTTHDLSVEEGVQVIKKVLISATKFDFTARWSGDATCLNDEGKAIGPSQRVGGTYSSFELRNIDVTVKDEFCEGGRYCQPDLQTLQVELRLDDPEDVLARNYFGPKIEEACRQIDCSQLPTSCRDGQERTAMWVYSKWFIEKCLVVEDWTPDCTCDFPVAGNSGHEIPTAGLTWVNVAPWNTCTYGLKGSVNYDSIPDNHKMEQWQFDRRRTDDEENLEIESETNSFQEIITPEDEMIAPMQ